MVREDEIAEEGEIGKEEEEGEIGEERRDKQGLLYC